METSSASESTISTAMVESQTAPVPPVEVLEAATVKTSIDPKQRCLLYCLDLISLCGANGMQAHELWQHVLTNSDFTQEMRESSGASDNLESFIHFLSQHTLFSLKPDPVEEKQFRICVLSAIANSSADIAASQPPCPQNGKTVTETVPAPAQTQDENLKRDTQSNSKNHDPRPSLNLDGEVEAEIVKRIVIYLVEDKLNDKWIEIAGLVKEMQTRHRGDANFLKLLSSASGFREFLLKHSTVFDVQGELLGLRRRSTTKSSAPKTPTASVTHRPERVNASGSTPRGNLRPKSLHIQRSIISEGLKEPLQSNCQNILDLSKSNQTYNSASFTYSAPTTPVKSISQSLPSISANEYKAVLCISKLLYSNKSSTPGTPLDHKSTNHRADNPFTSAASPFMSIAQLNERLSREADHGVRNTIGYTQIELEEFLHKHDVFFQFRKGQVARKAIEDIHRSIVITGSRPVMESVRTLCNQTGRVCHVSKQWSILDLGNHEHVFFDKSIFKHVTDLRTHFKINEVLYFNAILAPKGSRARWRATHVWKEADRTVIQNNDYVPTRPSATIDTPFGHVPVQPFLMHTPIDLGTSLKSPSTATNRQRPHGKSGTATSADPCWSSFNGTDPHSGRRAWDSDNWRQQSSSAAATPVTSQRAGVEEPSAHLNIDRGNTSSSPRANTDIKSVKQILLDRAKVHETIPEVSTDKETCTTTTNSSSPKPVRTMNVIATQTLITGDIMATQFFHEG